MQSWYVLSSFYYLIHLIFFKKLGIPSHLVVYCAGQLVTWLTVSWGACHSDSISLKAVCWALATSACWSWGFFFLLLSMCCCATSSNFFSMRPASLRYSHVLTLVLVIGDVNLVMVYQNYFINKTWVDHHWKIIVWRMADQQSSTIQGKDFIYLLLHLYSLQTIQKVQLYLFPLSYKF